MSLYIIAHPGSLITVPSLADARRRADSFRTHRRVTVYEIREVETHFPSPAPAPSPKRPA